MMRLKNVIVIAGSAVLMTGCASVYEEAADTVASAQIRDRSGAVVGNANFYSLAGEMTVSATFSGLAAGTHAVHLHTAGDCSANDFTSAGGHLNPGGNEHGTRNPRGAHLGDLPNVTIAADGSGSVSALLRGRSADVIGHLFDSDGTAIVVHEGADDYVSDPAGAAGSRVACGVVTRS